MGRVKAWLMELEERRYEDNLSDYETKLLEQIDEDREAYEEDEARAWWEHDNQLIKKGGSNVD